METQEIDTNLTIKELTELIKNLKGVKNTNCFIKGQGDGNIKLIIDITDKEGKGK